MDAQIEQRLAGFVKPLYLGVDGASRFDRVEWLLARLPELAAPPEVDAALLRAMAYLHDLDGWLGKMGNRGRIELFLRGCGMDDAAARRLLDRSARYRKNPRSAEERVLHDAVRLLDLGPRGVAELFWQAGRERWTLTEAIAELERRLDAVAFTTPRGTELGEPRVRVAREFAAELRRDLAAEGA